MRATVMGPLLVVAYALQCMCLSGQEQHCRIQFGVDATIEGTPGIMYAYPHARMLARVRCTLDA